MKKKREVISAIGFIICFLLLFTYTTSLIMPKGNAKFDNVKRMDTFYRQPKNTIDVLFLGASTIRNGISPLTMWEEFGFTSYVRATSSQSPMITYYYLLETLKYQSPKVVIIDGGSLLQTGLKVDENEPSNRKAIDPMRFSLIKLNLIFDMQSHSENQTIISYLFPILRYHDRWKDITKIDFTNDRYDPYKGQYVVFTNEPADIPNDFMEHVGTASDPVEEVYFYHKKIIDLCKQKGIILIYLDLPRLNKSTYSKYLSVKNFAAKNDVIYINYSFPEILEEVGFDPLTDLENSNHLNTFGSIKFSRHLASYLESQFTLPNRKNSDVAAQWDEDYRIFERQIEEHSN